MHYNSPDDIAGTGDVQFYNEVGSSKIVAFRNLLNSGGAKTGTTLSRLLNTSSSSLENSIFSNLNSTLENQSFIRFDNAQNFLQTPKSFFNEKGNSFYELFIDGKYYVKYDLSDGRILLTGTDGKYYAFAQTQTPLIIQPGQDFDGLIRTHLITQSERLANISGVGTNRAATIPWSGQVINPSTSKTTTFIGRMSDIDELKLELGSFKNVDVGENLGGINILNRPDVMWLDAGYDGWIRQHNMPWAKRVVQRGDDVYLASDPSNLEQLLVTRFNGIDVPTISAYEIRELILGDLKPINVTGIQWQAIKLKILEFERANKFIKYK